MGSLFRVLPELVCVTSFLALGEEGNRCRKPKTLAFY